MEFWHKYDMDSAGDKGIIDASYDGGNSWVVVNDTSNVAPGGSFFYWDSDYHAINGNYTVHKLVTSGISDGWIKSSFNWQWFILIKSDTIIINPDSLMIRFTFSSDSLVKNREGWMIDDIVTSSAGWELCSGIKEISNGCNLSVYPNPFSLYATLHTKNPMKHATLTVYNSFGQLVRQLADISGHMATLSRGNLPGGLYFIRLAEGNKMIAIEKLVITD